MPDESEYDSYFSTLGDIELGDKEGKSLRLRLFQCSECGSVIAARAVHFAMHNKLVIKPPVVDLSNA